MHLDKATTRRLALLMAGGIILYWGLHEVDALRGLISWVWNLSMPILIGAVVAFVINVPMRAVERKLTFLPGKGLRRGVALLIVLLLFVLVVGAILWLLIPQLQSTVSTLAAVVPEFYGKVQTAFLNFLEENPEVEKTITNYVSLESLDLSALIDYVVALLESSVTGLVNGAVGLVVQIANGAVNAVIAVCFALYALIRKDILARQARMLLYAFVSEKWADRILGVSRLTNSTFSSFISGQCLDACILASMVALVMAVLNFPFIPLVFVLVAVTALIPMVGAVVGCVLSALFILMVDPFKAIWFVVLFIAVQQVDNNLIYPRVVGSSIGLPSMWVLAAVTIGGSIMGVFGMLVMIPLVSVIHQLLREAAMRRLERKGTPKEKLATPEEEFLSVRQMKRQGKTVFRKREPDESGEAQEENGKPC